MRVKVFRPKSHRDGYIGHDFARFPGGWVAVLGIAHVIAILIERDRKTHTFI